METKILIYVIGFILIPIISIALNKIWPESIYKNQSFPTCEDDTNDRVGRFIIASFLWPLMTIIIFFRLLDHWYLNNKNN